MSAPEPVPPNRRPGLIWIRLGIVVFVVWAIFMGWHLAQVARTPTANAPAEAPARR